jgi:hypothetical protein
MLGGSLSPQHDASSGCLWMVTPNILNKQPRTSDKGWSSSLGVGHGANNPSPLKNKFVMTIFYRASDLDSIRKVK